jgi:hypothetical protein
MLLQLEVRPVRIDPVRKASDHYARCHHPSRRSLVAKARRFPLLRFGLHSKASRSIVKHIFRGTPQCVRTSNPRSCFTGLDISLGVLLWFLVDFIIGVGLPSEVLGIHDSLGLPSEVLGIHDSLGLPSEVLGIHDSLGLRSDESVEGGRG